MTGPLERVRSIVGLDGLDVLECLAILVLPGEEAIS
jgi:hypothetical protein